MMMKVLVQSAGRTFVYEIDARLSQQEQIEEARRCAVEDGALTAEEAAKATIVVDEGEGPLST